jgi:hypothetical protein
MIQIKPEINHQSNCPHCGSSLKPNSILWQGIHVCAVSTCSQCSAEIIEDLKIGHAIYYPYQVDLKANKLFYSNQDGLSWFGTPLLNSLQNPQRDVKVTFTVEKNREKKDVIILNCIDFLYGHSLLKLLNAEAHLNNNADIGLVVIVPSFLRWMVPQEVAEIWTVDIPLSKAQYFIFDLNERIQKECLRFNKIYVSRAHSHPKAFNISNFSGIQKHDFKEEKFRITFIWREDRLWNDVISGKIGRVDLANNFLLKCQNIKVTRLLTLLRNAFPDSLFTVAGLGTTTAFPQWIRDLRVAKYNADIEREVCKVYSESRIIIGVHGSNMLLPSAHAGMTVDLMSVERWGNISQDILYQEDDNRLASYRYRYLPLNVSVRTLSNIILSQLKWYLSFKYQMKDEFSIEI